VTPLSNRPCDSGWRSRPYTDDLTRPTQIAADLTAWTRLLACTGDAVVLATCEPKALRYRFLHVPVRLTHSAPRRRLRIPETWPWATAIVAVFANIAAIPQPA